LLAGRIIGGLAESSSAKGKSGGEDEACGIHS
jgi:hypothetical protein